MVETTKQERELPKKIFGKLITEIYPEYEDQTLKITQLTSRRKLAHVRTFNWKSKIILGINFSSWREMDSSRRLSLLLHELTHLKEGNHKPAFWREMADNYISIKGNRYIYSNMEFSDWRTVAERVICDANSASADLRMINQQEARLLIRDRLGVDVDIWEDLNPSSGRFPSPDTQKVRVKDVVVKNKFTDEELAEFWSEWDKDKFSDWIPPHTPLVKTVHDIEAAAIGEQYLEKSEKILAIIKRMGVEEFPMIFGRDRDAELVTRTEIENGWD